MAVIVHVSHHRHLCPGAGCQRDLAQQEPIAPAVDTQIDLVPVNDLHAPIAVEIRDGGACRVGAPVSDRTAPADRTVPVQDDIVGPAGGTDLRDTVAIEIGNSRSAAHPPARKGYWRMGVGIPYLRISPVMVQHVNLAVRNHNNLRERIIVEISYANVSVRAVGSLP